jgi:folate-binding protein YgfZ
LRTALASVPYLTSQTLETLRVEAGIPRWGVDFDTTTLALEIPNVLEVRVDQGCYVGQEVVARIVHRGHVNRHLLGLKFDGSECPARSDVIFHDGKEVGSITSSAYSPRFGALGLGYVRREVEPETVVYVGKNRQARIVNLPFQH